MRVAAIIPHLKMFGGVRRFLELHGPFTALGVDYVVYVNSQKGFRSECTWMDYKGKIENWDNIEADYVLIGDPPSFPVLKKVKGQVFVWVIAGGQYLPMYKGVEGVFPILVNNRTFLRYFKKAILVEGGVNVHHFSRTKKTRVLYYAGRGRIKGEQDIVEALGNLENIELIPMQNYPNESLPDLYSSVDYFVSWEKREGWSNTTAEALACGVPVVTNGVNCEPFFGKCIVLKFPHELREFFEDPMKDFSWKRVAERLINVFEGVKQ